MDTQEGSICLFVVYSCGNALKLDSHIDYIIIVSKKKNWLLLEAILVREHHILMTLVVYTISQFS